MCIFVIRRRRRGTIEMTLVHPCLCLPVFASVHLSVHQSVRPSSCPRNFSYVFHWIDLKFCTLSSYEDVHVISIFVSAISVGVIALAESHFVRATIATSLIELT